MSTPDYHDYCIEVTFAARHHADGFYAVPSSFNNFDPETGNPILDRDDDDDEILPDDWIYLGDDDDDAERELALRLHLDDFTSGMDVNSGRYTSIYCGHRSWYVLTDSEADDLWEEQLKSYIDDCLEIPDNLRNYFDEAKWIDDAKTDGRGHTLASYDGNEDEVTLSGTGTFYIFRTS